MRCYVKDGILWKVEADAEHPNYAHLCPKGLAAPELVYHEERLKYPLKRTRPKTSADPGWERISWEEALKTVSSRLLKIKEEFGPEAVVFGKGASGGTPANDYKDWVSRLAYAFGSPNNDLGTTHICNWHKDKGSVYTYGVGIPTPDFKNARVILLWGHNPAHTWRRHLELINQARRRGVKVIIIDPRRNETVKEGDLWLPVRPGTDGALALGMLNVVLSRRLYNEDFVRQWTTAPFLVRMDTGKFVRDEKGNYVIWDEKGQRFVDYNTPDSLPALWGTYRTTIGDTQVETKPAFQLLQDLVMLYPPEEVARITSVPAELIVKASTLFYTAGPSCYYSYNGIEQHTNAMQTNRAISLFFALSGNFDIPGGNVLFPRIKTNKVDGKEEFAPKQPSLSKKRHPLGPGNVQAFDLYRAILEGNPYPVKAVVSFGGNVLTANGDTRKGWEALTKLEFFVLADLFETPAGRLADILLPAASPWESFFLKTTFEGDEKTSSHVQFMPPVIEPLYECKPDIEIIFALAVNLGLGDKFWQGDIRAAFNYQLAPSGLTLEMLEKNPGGISLSLPVHYEKYKEKGFATPSGRIEIYAERFLEEGYEPLPVYHEPFFSPFSRKDLTAEYPFVLTNAKTLAYCHGQHRAIPSLRKLVPYPFVEINETVARKRGIKDGDWVFLKTPIGKIKLKAKLSNAILPGVVCTQHGWWQGCTALDLPAYDPLSEEGANINLVITNDFQDPITGSVPHKSYLCDIVKI